MPLYLSAMQIGDKLTITAPFLRTDEPSRLTRMVEATKAHLEACGAWKMEYETFSAITSQGNPIAGCIAHRRE